MADFQSLRIALLEDEPEQADRVSAWIDGRGYQCGVFHSADEFQRAFRKTSFDVVVLDWCLDNGSSGIEVMQWIRKTLTSDIPIIFVTARQAEEDIVEALEAGARLLAQTRASARTVSALARTGQTGTTRS